MSAEIQALASLGIEVDRPKDLRNRIGRFMVDRGIFIGHRLDAGRVQDLIEQWTRYYEGYESPICDSKKQYWKCQCCGTVRVYGLTYPMDSSEKQLNCSGCKSITPHLFAYMRAPRFTRV